MKTTEELAMAALLARGHYSELAGTPAQNAARWAIAEQAQRTLLAAIRADAAVVEAARKLPNDRDYEGRQAIQRALAARDKVE